MIYRFWLPLGIFWPLCCLFFYDIQILITPLVSFGHCVVCSSMTYGFWFPLGRLCFLFFYDYGFWISLGIFWPLCCLFFYDLQILITPLVSFGHCVVCSSMIYRFWLHPWYLLAIVLSVLLWYTDSDYTLGIFWPLCCLFFYDIQILITPLVSFGHCVVCSSMIYRFWLHPWYLLAIVLSVLLWYTDSDYPLGIFWPLCCLFFYDLRILITPLVSFGHCVVCSSMIYGFWLSLGIFWPLCCLFFYDIQILITPLVSFGHCVVCSSMIYRFWLTPWYLLAIVLSVLLWYTDSDYPLGIFWPLCCLFFYDIQILITPLVSFGHCVVCSSMIYRFWLHPWYLLAIVLSGLLWYTDSDYTLGIFWALYCLFLYDIQILITPLVSFGHCVVCSSMIYRFSLPPWYLLAIVLSVLICLTDSDFPLGIFWQLCCLFFYDLRILNIPWYLLDIVLFVLLWFTDSDYTLGIFWPLCCLFFYDIQILINPLVSFGHCVVCSSMIYTFWLPPWYLLAIVLSVLLWYIEIWLHPCYLLAIVLSVLLWYTDSDYTLGIFWPLCCLVFYDIQILITPLVSFGHCIVCFYMIHRFWLSPWYLLAILFSVLLWYTDYDYTLGIFWPLCCLFFYDIQILITPLVSFGHCVVCFSMIYRFWLLPWYSSAIVLSVLLWLTESDFPLGIFCQLCFLFFYDLRILNIPWYLLDIVLFVLLWFTDSDYTLGIFWPLCCLFFYDIQILINPLVSFGHCVVCSSMIYRFWLPPGIFWPLCCLFFYDI